MNENMRFCSAEQILIAMSGELVSTQSRCSATRGRQLMCLNLTDQAVSEENQHLLMSNESQARKYIKKLMNKMSHLMREFRGTCPGAATPEIVVTLLNEDPQIYSKNNTGPNKSV